MFFQQKYRAVFKITSLNYHVGTLDLSDAEISYWDLQKRFLFLGWENFSSWTHGCLWARVCGTQLRLRFSSLTGSCSPPWETKKVDPSVAIDGRNSPILVLLALAEWGSSFSTLRQELSLEKVKYLHYSASGPSKE
jgi:hypothetical protein